MRRDFPLDGDGGMRLFKTPNRLIPNLGMIRLPRDKMKSDCVGIRPLRDTISSSLTNDKPQAQKCEKEPWPGYSFRNFNGLQKGFHGNIPVLYHRATPGARKSKFSPPL